MNLAGSVISFGVTAAPFVIGIPLVQGLLLALQLFGVDERGQGLKVVGLMVLWTLFSGAVAFGFFVLAMAHCCREQVQVILVTIVVVYPLVALTYVLYQIRLARRFAVRSADDLRR